MQRLVFLLTIIAVAGIISSTNAQQTVVIPAYTVIPATLDGTLNSATSRVGDTFNASCAMPNCGGFPPGTTFTGRVDSVTRASRGVPGEIEVSFFRATLPDNSTININGGLTSLHRNDVVVDPNTGLLTQRVEQRSQRDKFTSVGAKAGATIGVIGSRRTVRGALEGAAIGAATGWLAGTAADPRQVYNDVNLPPGTDFGIVLRSSVTLTRPSTSAGVGAGPGGSLVVQYGTLRPLVAFDGNLIVPFRETMTALNIPFRYLAGTDTLVVTSPQGTFRHVIGTRTATMNGRTISLSTKSTMINNMAFVPVDFVEAVTGRSSTWDANNNRLTLQ